MSALDKKKTFTDMQFVNLLESDLSIKAARKQILWKSKGMANYNMQYWTWKHDYRSRYSEEFLKKYGYESTSSASLATMNNEKLFEYIDGKVVDLNEIIDRNINIPSMDTAFRLHLQDNYDWSNRDELLIYEGNTWELDYVSYLEFNQSYRPDDIRFLVGNFTCITATKLPLQIQIDNTLTGSRSLVLKYTLTTGDIDEFYFYIEPVSTCPDNLWTEDELVMTPIITMKENGNIVQESKNMRKMMNKLNVDSKDFEESLTELDDDNQPKIDNAYLLNGLSAINPYEIKVKQYSPTEAQPLPVALLQKIIHSGESTKIPPPDPPPGGYNEWGGVDYYGGYTEDGSYVGGNQFGVPIAHGLPDDEPAGRYDNRTYNVTQKIADDWYNDNLREQSYLARALFRTFAYYVGIFDREYLEKKSNPFFFGEYVEDTPGIIHSGSMLFEQNGLDLQYSFDVEVETIEGRVRPEVNDKRSQCSFHFSGTEISTKNEEGDRTNYVTSDSLGYDLLEIKVQITEDTYQVMKITNYSNTFIISERSFKNTLGSPEQEHRILLPYFALQELKFTEYVTVYEHSFMFLAYAIKTVVIKWYKRFIGAILAIVLCVLGQCHIGALILKVLVSIAVTLALELIMELVDSDILKLVLQIVVMLIAAGLGGFDFADLTMENYLKIATQVSKQVFGYYEQQMMKEKAIEKKEDDAEERIEEKLANADSMMNLTPKVSTDAHYSFADQNGSAAFYNNALGAALFNFDQYYDVDGQIELRKQVKSG